MLKKINYINLKFIVNSSGIKTDFSELRDPLTFLKDFKIGIGRKSMI